MINGIVRNAHDVLELRKIGRWDEPPMTVLFRDVVPPGAVVHLTPGDLRRQLDAVVPQR